MANNTEDNRDQHGGGDITPTNKECTSCEQNDVETITEGIDRAAIREDVSTCASCGKEGNSDDMNKCNKCKSVKYCNAACKKKHRKKHKKACEKRVAELHEEALFKEGERDECPICFLTLPLENGSAFFQSCCGKTICIGCMYTMDMSGGKDLCAFCRTPGPTSNEDHIKRTKKLMKNGNGEAFKMLARAHEQGIMGLQQDQQKANELYLKAGELGCDVAYHNLGCAYGSGRGVERDEKKAKHYYELAAMGGNTRARYVLGCFEGQVGNYHRAYKHYMIAARAGYKESLDAVKEGFMYGFVTKDEYARTLQTYHDMLKEMKSEIRDKAAIYYAEEGLFTS